MRRLLELAELAVHTFIETYMLIITGGILAISGGMLIYGLSSGAVVTWLASIAISTGSGFAEVWAGLAIALIMLATVTITIIAVGWAGSKEEILTDDDTRSIVERWFAKHASPITTVELADQLDLDLFDLQRVLDTMADLALVREETNPDPTGPKWLYSARPAQPAKAKAKAKPRPVEPAEPVA